MDQFDLFLDIKMIHFGEMKRRFDFVVAMSWQMKLQR